MLLIGYCYGIRSERRLYEEVNMNLAYRWFCRLSLDDQVPDHSTFSKNRHGRFRDIDTFRFIFDDKANEYRCPQGKTLRTTGRVTVDNTRLYRTSHYDCMNCPDKYRCCPNTPSRKIARSVHEVARDRARDLAKTPEYQQSMKERKKVEMLFAHLKRILKLDRLRLRGLSGAHDEFLLAATAQNLRRMAKWYGHGPSNAAIELAT